MNPNPIELERDLILEYFKSIRVEIHLRIEQHNKLWFQKILICGAVLSYGLSDKGIAVYGCALVPFIAIVFDLLIINNLGVIRHLGQYNGLGFSDQ